jgi:trk system potassium uptake protein
MSMFVGRVGLLTLALTLSSRVATTSYKYPTAHIMIG